MMLCGAPIVLVLVCLQGSAKESTKESSKEYAPI